MSKIITEEMKKTMPRDEVKVEYLKRHKLFRIDSTLNGVRKIRIVKNLTSLHLKSSGLEYITVSGQSISELEMETKND